jgi:hypothetical protein
MCTISTLLVYDACSFQQRAFQHQRMLSLLVLYPQLLGVQHWYCQSRTHIYLWWDPRPWQMPWESLSSMQTKWLNTLRSVVIVGWTRIWFGPGLELDILPAQFPGELESCYLVDDFLSLMATRKWNPVTESLPGTVCGVNGTCAHEFIIDMQAFKVLWNPDVCMHWLGKDHAVLEMSFFSYSIWKK